MDRRLATTEVMTRDETVLVAAVGIYAAGYPETLAYASTFRSGSGWSKLSGYRPGTHADRLLGDGENVADVPPKSSAPAQVFGTGQGWRCLRQPLGTAFIGTHG
jgi:hypothetical protein